MPRSKSSSRTANGAGKTTTINMVLGVLSATTAKVEIDGIGSLSFWAVVNKSEGDNSGLRLLERQRMKMWLKRAFAQIAKVGV